MMNPVLLFVIVLAAWSLHLIRTSIQCKEFSLLLAGFLVASSAAAMVGVYFLMGDCVGYLAQSSHRAALLQQEGASPLWLVQVERSAPSLTP